MRIGSLSAVRSALCQGRVRLLALARSRRVRRRAANVPSTPVALVLGSLETDGRPSAFLQARLDVARELYARGKVRAILVSGDNSRPDYDEPTAGREYLVARGVPAGSIALDYAGFDTYDSCVRAHRIFGVTRLTVVTQDYHLPRAVALCRSVGVDAVGAGTDAHQSSFYGFVAEKRELFANVKAALDTATGRDPVFLGPPEESVRAALARPPR
jgi:vancomycin permeability regulator SanA